MKFVFALLFGALLGTITHAQSDYVVTVQGDTTYGKIDILLPTNYYDEIVIKGKDKRRFKAHQMVEFVARGITYQTIKYGNKYRIMKLIQPGYMGLYAYRIDNSFDFGTACLKKVTGEVLEVPNFNFKKIIFEFIKNCPSVAEDVNNKVFRKSNIKEMVQAYNDCISSGEVEITQKEPGEKSKTKKSAKQEASPTIKALEKLSKAIAMEKGETGEIMNIITDIRSKLNKGQNIPAYLKSALTEEASRLPSIRPQLDKVLELIK